MKANQIKLKMVEEISKEEPAAAEEKAEVEHEWFLAIDGKPEGPYQLRDLDVKYRTNELASSTFAWREGLPEWKPLFEIQEIKQVLQGKSVKVKH